jgi:transcriptional regulator of acetoin/glycerol metabolism
VLDNLSSLCRSGKENEAESWLEVQTWALRHRSAGRSVLFIHHSGKGGQQRGTSRREDVLDTVIQLRNPADYEMSEGARFEIVFEKARGLCGDAVETFEAVLGPDEHGKLVWTVKKASIENQIISMTKDGMRPDIIAVELGMSRATVYRKIRQAKESKKLPGNVVAMKDKKKPK